MRQYFIGGSARDTGTPPQPLQYILFVEQQRHATSQTHHLVLAQATKMSSQDERARLFQKMVVFKYAADNIWKQPKEVLVIRDTVAQYNAAVATAANHFAASDDGGQEIYFTCTPHKTWRQIEIPPSSWAETLPLFSVIEVRKRSKWDSSTRAVREQVAVSGPMPPPPTVRQWTARAWLITITVCILALWGIYIYILPSPPPPKALRPSPPVDHDFSILSILICILTLWALCRK